MKSVGATATPQHEANVAAISVRETKSFSWVPRPAHVALTVVVLLALTWGTFRIIERQPRRDDESELADFNFKDAKASKLDPRRSPDAPESEAELLDESHRNTRNKPTVANSDGRGLPAMSLSRENTVGFYESPAPTATLFVPTESGAWLTGSIESSEQSPRLPSSSFASAADLDRTTPSRSSTSLRK